MVEKLRFSSFMWFIISDFSSAVHKYGDDKKSKISALNLSPPSPFGASHKNEKQNFANEILLFAVI